MTDQLKCSQPARHYQRMHTNDEAPHVLTIATLIAAVYGREHATATDREAVCVLLDLVAACTGSPTNLHDDLREKVDGAVRSPGFRVAAERRAGADWATRIHCLAVTAWLVGLIADEDHFDERADPFLFGWRGADDSGEIWTMERAVYGAYMSLGEDTSTVDDALLSQGDEEPGSIRLALLAARRRAPCPGEALT